MDRERGKREYHTVSPPTPSPSSMRKCAEMSSSKPDMKEFIVSPLRDEEGGTTTRQKTTLQMVSSFFRTTVKDENNQSAILPSPQSPLASFTSSNFVEPDLYDYHLKSSIVSNLLFMNGSIIYMQLSRMDLDYANNNDESNHINDDAYDGGYDYYADEKKWDNYTILQFVGAIGFVFNATWDMYWCYGRERERQEKIDKGEESDDEEENELSRADEKRTFSASFAFGIAGSIDLVVALYIQNDNIAAMLSIASSHIYLLSAILSLWASTFSYDSIPTCLALCGDLLFALGSIIDVIISYISDPEILRLSDNVLAGWACLSSALWVIDACLYLFADATVVWYNYRSYCCPVKWIICGRQKANFAIIKPLS